jgi:hypothetical protein
MKCNSHSSQVITGKSLEVSGQAIACASRCIFLSFMAKSPFFTSFSGKALSCEASPRTEQVRINHLVGSLEVEGKEMMRQNRLDQIG